MSSLDSCGVGKHGHSTVRTVLHKYTVSSEWSPTRFPATYVIPTHGREHAVVNKGTENIAFSCRPLPSIMQCELDYREVGYASDRPLDDRMPAAPRMLKLAWPSEHSAVINCRMRCTTLRVPALAHYPVRSGNTKRGAE
jgi:hypothetical protein